jgi:hypothetical protein
MTLGPLPLPPTLYNIFKINELYDNSNSRKMEASGTYIHMNVLALASVFNTVLKTAVKSRCLNF